MKNKPLIWGTLLLAVSALVSLVVLRNSPPTESSAPSARESKAERDEIPAFSLTNQDNHSVGAEDLLGSAWVGAFIFTRCQGPCPVITMRMRNLQKEFGDRGIRFVSFTVDPEFDNPAVLKAYGIKYNADFSSWDFLTGDKNHIYTLMQNGFKLGVPPVGSGADDGHIPHTVRLVLVDQAGRLAGTYNTTDTDHMAALQSALKTI